MRFFKLTIYLIIILSIFIGFREINRALWRSPTADAETIQINIESETSFRQATEILAENNLIEKPFYFKVYARLSNQRTIQAGTFDLAKGSSYKTLLEKLKRAKQYDIQITIPEGLTIAQTGEIMVSKLNFSIEDWNQASINLEGYLFPDTYRFNENATAEMVIDTMIENFNRRISEANLEISERDLIIASIIEREVRGLEDMKKVSDIIRKRLEIGMALQMDSTVNFITGNKTPSITFADRDIDSPYNTYKYPGLPPGPIANPGLDALIATKNPTPNNYYYFLTNPQGKVFYGETFDQHVANRVHLR